MQLWQSALLCWSVSASVLHKSHLRSSTWQAQQTKHLNSTSQVTTTFNDYYNAVSAGRGIWKWAQALEAYQLHFGRFAGQPVKVLEIGVQSGGSIGMYKAVLGGNCHYYGMDINPRCTGFADPQATITILDQGNSAHWQHFFSSITPSMDIVVDDGGHKAYQMLTTLQQVLPRINPGGVFLTEDIHGQNEDYLSGFFTPAAEAIAANIAKVASVHLYPFVSVVQCSGGSYTAPPPLTTAIPVTSIEQMVVAMHHNPGATIHLSIPGWSQWLTAPGLQLVFRTFYDLYGGKVNAEPSGCFSTTVGFPQCTMFVSNTELQSLVTAVDIYPSFVQVHLAPQPPTIYATRKGTEWIPYSG